MASGCNFPVLNRRTAQVATLNSLSETSSSPPWAPPRLPLINIQRTLLLMLFSPLSQTFLQISFDPQFSRKKMINDLNLTPASHTTSENGCRKAALSSPFAVKDMSETRSGSGSDSGRPGKRKREMAEEGTDHEMELKEMRDNLKCFSYGFVSMIGRRREMEDAVAVAVEMGFPATGKEYDFFGVYDGHGGSRVANACRERLHELLSETMMGEGVGEEDVVGWEKAMVESFEKMDTEVNLVGAAVASMGSTAVVAVVGEKEVVIANCGDSRAVLSRDGAAVPLSIDHKPNRADELERIELLGGKVIDWNGHRVLGVLSTSRSIGDEYLKPYVIPIPQVTISERTKGDEFIILASDGLWDVIPNDVACHIVRRCLKGHVKRRPPFKIPAVSAEMPAILTKNDGVAAEAASILAELAIARGSTDNISVIVVQLEAMKGSSSSSSRGGAKAVRKSSGGTVVGQSSGTVH